MTARGGTQIGCSFILQIYLIIIASWKFQLNTTDITEYSIILSKNYVNSDFLEHQIIN